MSKIMLIGDSLPLFTTNAALTNAIAEQLHSSGSEVYLLSKAWCKVKEENFYGNAEQNCTPYPYQKRFYVDPLQIRTSNAELLTAMLGLALKVIDEESIDFVIFADDLSFIPLVELIRARRSLPCFLYMFDMRHNYECLIDNYMMAGLTASLQSFDAIFTFPSFKEFLNQLFMVPEEKIVITSPLPIDVPEPLVRACKKDKLYILIEQYSDRKAKLAFSTGMTEMKDVFKEHLVCTPNGAADASKLSLEAHQCVKPEEIPRGAAVITYTTLVSDYTTSWDDLLLFIRNGWIPLIRDSNRTALGEYVSAANPAGPYYMLESLRFPWADAEKAAISKFQSIKEQISGE